MKQKHLIVNSRRENAKIFLEENPNIAAEIEMAIREKAGVISKKIEGNPLDPEKAAKDQIEDPEAHPRIRHLSPGPDQLRPKHER